MVFHDSEVRVDAVGLHRLICEEQEHPHASSNCGAIEVEDVAFEDCVCASWNGAEGPNEEECSDQGTMLGLKPLQ